VASTIRSAVTWRPSTSRSLLDRKEARACTTSIPSRRKVSSPSVAATAATTRRASARADSKGRLRAAASMIVLEGMQPVNVQSPPIGLSEIRSVPALRWVAVRAAAIPAAPPPITTRS
jgi:hypothetical protein